jgi:hypothetical protein
MKAWNWYCPQHACNTCNKKASEAGNMLYCCRWCPDSFCEDCLDWDNTTLLGDTLDEYELLGFHKSSTAYYIVCAHCNEANDDLKSSFDDQAQIYKEELKRVNDEAAGDHDMAEASDDKVESSDSGNIEIIEPTHVFRPKDLNINMGSAGSLLGSRRSSIAPSLTDISTGVTASGVTTPKGGDSFFSGGFSKRGKRKSAVMMEDGYFEDDGRSVRSKLGGGSESGSFYE